MPDDPATSDLSAEIARVQRAQEVDLVGRQVFQDFGLSAEEQESVDVVLSDVSGGAELKRILDRAREQSGDSWPKLSQDRRVRNILGAMAFHGSAADLERMALRTGGALLLAGQLGVGSKILGRAPSSKYGTRGVGSAGVLIALRLALYAVFLVVIVAEGFLTGEYLFVVAGILAVGAAIGLLWWMERPLAALRSGEGEALRYTDALRKVSLGTPPASLFDPDGSLRPSG